MLTRNIAQNDPIDWRIKGTLLCDFEHEFWHLRSDFLQFSQWNLTFKHSLDAEVDVEEEESKSFKDWNV